MGRIENDTFLVGGLTGPMVCQQLQERPSGDELSGTEFTPLLPDSKLLQLDFGFQNKIVFNQVSQETHPRWGQQ